MDTGKDSSMPALGLLWRSDPEEGDPSTGAAAPGHLQTGSRYEVGGEVPRRSLGGKILLNGPLALLR
jgi:hypothetical protein